MNSWKIDPMHSEVQFKVKHLMISTVTGSFGTFDGELKTNEEGNLLDGAEASFTAQIASISTGNEQRDGHLKSADFFDAENHPELSFKSTNIISKGDNAYDVEGELSIRGNTKTIILKTTYGGEMIDFYGNTKAGFELEGKISRKEFGLTWDATTEAGGIVVSDEVKLQLNVQFSKVMVEETAEA